MDRRQFLVTAAVTPALVKLKTWSAGDDAVMRPDRWLELVATVPPYPNRQKEGTIALRWSDAAAGVELGSWRVYAKAGNDVAKDNGNSTRDPMKGFGDTPTGRYGVEFIFGVPTKAYNERTYGNSIAVVMHAKEGQAKDSKRTGIWIHGGDLAPDGIVLRPTGGCLRMRNGDLDVLLTKLLDDSLSGVKRLDVIVREAPASVGAKTAAVDAKDANVVDPVPTPDTTVTPKKVYT